MKIINQRGFTALEAVLLVIVLGIMGSAGYLLWHHNHPNIPKTPSVEAPAATPATETSAWTSIHFRDQSFTMKVPDGWILLRSTKDVPEEVFTTLDSRPKPGTKAVVTDSATISTDTPIVSIREDPKKELALSYTDGTPFRTAGLTGTHSQLTTDDSEGQPGKATASVLHEYYFAHKGKGLLVSVTVTKGDTQDDQVVAQLEKALVTLR